MKKPNPGTEPPLAFAVELGAGWERWARHRTEAELEEIRGRLTQVLEGFGKPYLHGGLGLRRLTPRLFEFRTSKGTRVVLAYIKPRTFRLAMTGSHDEVRAWLRESL